MLRRIKCSLKGGHRWRDGSYTIYGCMNCYPSLTRDQAVSNSIEVFYKRMTKIMLELFHG